MPNASADVDIEALKQVHRAFVSGVTIVTTNVDGVPRGLAVSAFSSVSLDPPLILVCVQKTSSTYPSLFASSHFGVNILSTDQGDVVKRFATKAADKFAGIDWRPAAAGTPIIEGSSASLVARIGERLQTNTHTVFMGHVVEAEYSAAAPMVYSAGALYEDRKSVV